MCGPVRSEAASSLRRFKRVRRPRPGTGQRGRRPSTTSPEAESTADAFAAAVPASLCFADCASREGNANTGVRQRKDARLVGVPTHACCCSTPIAATAPSWPLRSMRGSLSQTAAEATKRTRSPIAPRERPLARRRLAPRRRGVALGASRSADSGTIRSYAAGAQQSQRAPHRRW